MPNLSLRHSGCIGALLSLVPLALTAQRDTIRSDSTTVRRHALPPVVVTGTLSPFVVEKFGMSRTVVSSQQLRAEPTKTAVDLLRHVTGVHIDEGTGPLGPTVIRIRGGEESFTQVLVDGVPINENGGFFDAQGVTMTNVDRVEVVRGPQSALYGSSAISGVVQMFTRAGDPGPLRTEAMLEAGRASMFGGSVRGSVVGQGGSSTTLYAFGVGSSYDRGPYRLPNDVRSNDGSLRVDLLPALAGGAFSWTAITRFLGVDAHQPVRDPGATRAPLDSNQRQGRDRFLGSLAGTWTPSARWTHRTTVSYYRRYFSYDDRFDNLDQSQFSTYVFDANFHYEAVVRRAIARYVGTVAGQPLRDVRGSLSFGSEWQRESLRDNQSGDFGPASSSIARPSVSAFGEGQVRVRDRVSLLAGSRVEKFRGLDAAFVPRVTTVLDLVRNRVSLRGGISHAYKAPNIQDQFPSSAVFVTNPNLKPETSRSWEVGTDLRASPWGGAANAAVTYFHQDFDNLIRSVGYDSTRQINRNLGRSRATGIEAEASVSPRSRWTVGAEGAWTTTKVIDNGGLSGADFPNGEALPFRPAYTASAYVAMPLARRVSMIVRTTGVGRQTVLANRFSGPRVSIAPYQLFSGTATWSASSRTDVYAQVENLLDRTYDTAYDRMGIHRTVTLGLRARP